MAHTRKKYSVENLGQDLGFSIEFFDALPVYVLLFESDGTLKTANRTFLEAVGLTREETAGLSLPDLERYYKIEGGSRRFAELEPDASRTFFSRLIDKEGRVFSLEQTLVPVCSEGWDGVLSFGHDITELTTQQHKLEQDVGQDGSTEKENHRKRAVISNINHEIRTPMNAIIGYAEMLSASPLGDREQRFVKTIRKNGTVLMELLNDILGLSNRERLETDTGVYPAFQHTVEKEERQPIILVVDDMPVIAAVIQDYFNLQPVEVLVAENSTDCRELARSRQPDLILMDLNLAGVDGLELTCRLKKDSRTSRIPVVVMTGRVLETKEYTSIFDDFLTKPFHLQELQSVVDRFIHIKDSASSEITQVDMNISADQEVQQLRSAWDEDLAALLDQALESGSLDAAFNLGKSMFERGEQSGVEPLKCMGKQLKDDASFPDIIGVEELLTTLQRYTGEQS